MPEPKPVGWLSIITIYVYTVLSMATVGVVIAVTGDFARTLSVTPKDIGLAIAMFSAPSALFATVGGSIIDRFGAKPAMIVSAVICVLADAMAFGAQSTLMLNLALLMAGLGFAGISVAAPAMIVTTIDGKLQVKAMSLWSTYAPTGFALGLLLGAPFAETALWGVSIGLHGLLMAVAVVSGVLLPGHVLVPRAAIPLGQRLKALGQVVREAPVLRLSIAMALPAAISYGTSMVAPSYLARVHGVGIGASATSVALAKAVAMILCGVVMGQILSRRINTFALFAVLCIGGVLAQIAIFYPGGSLAAAIGGLVIWLLAYGGAAAAGMAMLPKVIRDPAHSGAASGLIGQVISVASFMTPTVYFGMQGWMGFVAVAAIGMAISLLALPARQARAAAQTVEVAA